MAPIIVFQKNVSILGDPNVIHIKLVKLWPLPALGTSLSQHWKDIGQFFNTFIRKHR